MLANEVPYPDAIYPLNVTAHRPYRMGCITTKHIGRAKYVYVE